VVGNAHAHVQRGDANTHAQSRDEITCTEMYVCMYVCMYVRMYVRVCMSSHKQLKVSYAFKRVEELCVFINFFCITFRENLFSSFRVLTCIQMDRPH
jgi:hypothetical protein